MLDGREFDMGIRARIDGRIDGWSRRSQERAVANARDAATALSRARVEREEIELYLRSRAGEMPVVAAAVAHAVRLA